MSERIGVIGGTGLYQMDDLEGKREVTVATPFGEPSDAYTIGEIAGRSVVFLPRHGRGHRLLPTESNYRANVFGLKTLGVTHLISVSAVGSMKEEYQPGHVVVPDQFFDRTGQRPSTFFGNGLVAHVSLADPTCAHLSLQVAKALTVAGAVVHFGGTYLCMEGPQFSTRAESHMHRAWGGDLIGMTCMPEAKLAREAEMCYALVAFPTDYDCWRAHEDGRDEDDLLREILSNLKKGTDAALGLIREAVGLIGNAAGAQSGDGLESCRCRDALKLALWSEKSRISGDTKKRLDLLVGRHLADG